MSDPVLEVSNLSAGFMRADGHVKAVSNVSFLLRAGEKLAVVGESGSGKSTLGLALLGLLDPPGSVTSGKVFLNGRQILGLREIELKRLRGREISLVYQDPMGALDPIKTIGRQITDTLRHHQPTMTRRQAEERALALLQEVEIPNAAARLRQYPHHFSGGMRQRVLIAIAIANNPQVIIADEPTTALDVTTQAQILALLDRLVKARGASLLMITHNLKIVADFCDTLQVMYAGRFVERGNVSTVFANPVHPYTRGLMASMPTAAAKGEPLPVILGSPPDLRIEPIGCAFASRCLDAQQVVACRELAPPIRLGDEAGSYAVCHMALERSSTEDD